MQLVPPVMLEAKAGETYAFDNVVGLHIRFVDPRHDGTMVVDGMGGCDRSGRDLGRVPVSLVVMPDAEPKVPAAVDCSDSTHADFGAVREPGSPIAESISRPSLDHIPEERFRCDRISVPPFGEMIPTARVAEEAEQPFKVARDQECQRGPCFVRCRCSRKSSFFIFFSRD